MAWQVEDVRAQARAISPDCAEANQSACYYNCSCTFTTVAVYRPRRSNITSTINHGFSNALVRFPSGFCRPETIHNASQDRVPDIQDRIPGIWGYQSSSFPRITEEGDSPSSPPYEPSQEKLHSSN